MNVPIDERIHRGPIILLIVAFLIVNFLFFIDEGWYDLRWMMQPGNWLVFFIYLGLLFGAEMVCHSWIFRRTKGSARIILSIIGGALLLFVMVFAIWGLAA